MQMMVYRNLTKCCWSIKNLSTRRVQSHADHLVVFYPTFKVSQKGRERVVREKKKYVHAGVCGLVETSSWLLDYIVPHNYATTWVEVKYNPYVNTNFVFADGTEVKKVKYAYLDTRGKCFVCEMKPEDMALERISELDLEIAK